VISDEEIEAVVRTALHDLYPVPAAAREPRMAPERPRPRRGLALATALAAVVLVAAAVVIPAYLLRGDGSRANTSAGTPSTSAPHPTAPSTPSAAPAWTRDCIPPDDTRAVDYLGLTFGDAENLAHSRDITLIVVGMDGSCMPVEAKAFHNPMWVALSHSRVVEARYRGWSGPPR
jgi:hypothetical protein